MKDLSKFDGIILTKNFPLFCIKMTPGYDIILNDKFMSYITIINACLYIVNIAEGKLFTDGNYHFIADEALCDKLNYISKAFYSARHKKALQELAKRMHSYTGRMLSREVYVAYRNGEINNGMPLDDILILSKQNKIKHISYSERLLDDLIMFPKVKITREPDNDNAATFDFVTVTIVICMPYNDAKQFVKINQNVLSHLAIDAIACNNKFKEFEVPVNFLNLYSCTIEQDCTLCFNFSLKEV